MKSNDLSKKFLFYITRSKILPSEVQNAFSDGWNPKYIEVKSSALGDLAGETFAVNKGFIYFLLFDILLIIFFLFFSILGI
jgi:hypothetical protein